MFNKISSAYTCKYVSYLSGFILFTSITDFNVGMDSFIFVSIFFLGIVIIVLIFRYDYFLFSQHFVIYYLLFLYLKY